MKICSSVYARQRKNCSALQSCFAELTVQHTLLMVTDDSVVLKRPVTKVFIALSCFHISKKIV